MIEISKIKDVIEQELDVKVYISCTTSSYSEFLEFDYNTWAASVFFDLSNEKYCLEAFNLDTEVSVDCDVDKDLMTLDKVREWLKDIRSYEFMNA